MLIDTHAHLYWDSFKEDFDSVIARALEAEVNTIINIGVDIKTSQIALDQVKNNKWPAGLSVFSTIGIHPEEVLRLAPLAQDKLPDIDATIQQNMNKLEQIYQTDPKKVVGIGECGLDFLSGSKDLQKKLFQAQIDLAKKLNLPLVVHCRDDRSQNPQNSEAWDETLRMLGDNQPAILHCYSGLSPTTLRLCSGQAANLVVSFAANITYPKNEYLREAAKILPLNRILLETDSPFLAPQSKRGQRNEPSSVAEIAQLIADLKGISFEEIAKQTTENAKKIFKI